MHARAGRQALSEDLIDLDALLGAYESGRPDITDPAQRVVFGTSGHRGSSLDGAFNQPHILAIAQAVAEYRATQGVDGPLFVGRDTHGLSEPAWRTTLEVLVANGVEVLIDSRDGFTPTPAVSHAILAYNRANTRQADGILITPSHNPPRDGGIKYNPPSGGPAGSEATSAIAARANQLIEGGLAQVKRIPFDKAYAAAGRFDFLSAYIDDLPSVLDLDAIRDAGVRIGADPLGGAAVAYWGEVADRHRLNLTVVNDAVDPRWAFMPLDADGKIRMDCSSPSAMANEPQSGPGGGHRLSVRQSSRLGPGCGGRQDPGLIVDDRPRRRRSGPPPVGGACRVQAFRARPAGRNRRIRR
jgi:phosphoglucomutase